MGDNINQFSIIVLRHKIPGGIHLRRLHTAWVHIAILCILSLILVSCTEEEEEELLDKVQLNQTQSNGEQPDKEQPDGEQLNQTQPDKEQPDEGLLDNTFTISTTALPPQVNISRQQDIIVQLNLTSDMLLMAEHANKPLNLNISGMNYNLRRNEQDYACSPTIQASESSINAPAREDNSRLFSFSISQVLLADRDDECGNGPQIKGLALPPFEKISQVQLTGIRFVLNNTAQQLGQLNISGETTIIGDVIKRVPIILAATTGAFFINNNTPMGTIVGNISALHSKSYSIMLLDGGGMIDNINLNSPINFNNENGLLTASDNLIRGEYMYRVTAHNKFFNASSDFSVRVWTDDDRVSAPTSNQQISVYEGTIGRIGNVTALNAVDYQVQNIAGISTAELFVIDDEGNISVTELLDLEGENGVREAHQSSYSLLINVSNQFSYATFPLIIDIADILSELDIDFSSRITKPTTIAILNSVYSAAYNVRYIEEYDSSDNLLSIDDNGNIILSDAVNDAHRQNYALRFRETITSRDGSIKYYDENNGTLQLANIKRGNTETTSKNNYVNWWLYDGLNATDSANSTNIASMPNIKLGDRLVIRYPYIDQTVNSRFFTVKQVNQATAESCSVSGGDSDDGSDKIVLGSYFNNDNQQTASIPLRTPSGMLADANAFVMGGTYYIYSVNPISDDRSTKVTAFTETTTDSLCQRGLRIKWTIQPSTP